VSTGDEWDECAVSWRKSLACNGGECLEVAYWEDRALIRNSGTPDVVLDVPRSQWMAFITHVQVSTHGEA